MDSECYGCGWHCIVDANGFCEECIERGIRPDDGAEDLFMVCDSCGAPIVQVMLALVCPKCDGLPEDFVM